MILRRIVGLRNEKSGKNGPLSRICSRFILGPTGCQTDGYGENFHMARRGKSLRHTPQSIAILGTILLAALLTITLPACATTGAGNYLGRDELRAFIDEMADRHGFDRGELKGLFARIRPRPDIIAAISRPAEAMPWYKYRRIFLKKKRIASGVEFWRRHATVLQRAEREYGVPAEIIVAIIGVETWYGRHKGKFPVLESLATLSFDYPKRARFFRGELEQYLLLTREEGIDPLSLKGSYAGAMGMPQFIASSYRTYAVDFDGDGQRDLWNNPVDAIGSVAHYFARHGWKRGGQITARANVEGKGYLALIRKGLKPHTRIGQLPEHGVHPLAKLPEDDLTALIELELTAGREYWLGLNNFYVITRYNHSEKYAMAAYQLARVIRSEYYK